MKLRTSQPERTPRPKTVETAQAEAAQAESSLDAIRNIVDENWDKFLAAMREFSFFAARYVNIAHSLKLLLPERIAEIELDEDKWILAEADIEEALEHGLSCPELNTICSLAFLYPEQRAALPLERAWTKAYTEIQECRDSDLYTFALRASQLVQLFPERRGQLKLDESIKEKMLAELELNRNINWDDYVCLAENIRVLFPECKDELHYNESILLKIKETKNLNDKAELIRFLGLLTAMAVISADGVCVTQYGVELINYGHMGNAPALPDRMMVA